MKAAFLTYPAAFQNVGGGEIMLLKVAEYVRKKGVTVDLFDIWNSRLEQYDLLHVFGSVKDCLGLVRVANTRGVKVVNSPILWSDWRRALYNDGTPREKADLIARHLAKVLVPSFPSSRREIMMRSDAVLPNSEMEKMQIARLFALPLKKMDVVYNGVDRSFLDADPEIFRRAYGAQPFILAVGRIEPRKNQLNLIRGVKGIPGARLILIGSPVTGYEKYHEECRRLGAPFTTFIETLRHDDPLLKSAYAACSLFVLPAWFETPGLVALEAALAGAKVLATRGGSTVEYFGDSVPYLDPARPSDIREKVAHCLSTSPGNPILKKKVSESYLWEKVAGDYIRCYEKTLSKPKTAKGLA